LQKNEEYDDLIDIAHKNKNKSYRRFLKGTIIVGVFFLTFLLKFSVSNVISSEVRIVQEHGNTAEAKVENAGAEIVSSLSSSFHIKKIGKIYDLGKFTDNEQVFATCVFSDAETFQNMIRPSFTSFRGAYPADDKEILLSVETLRYMGINHPEIGMPVSADFYWNDLFQLQNTGEKTFTLSGYYDGMADTSTVYMSEEAKTESGINDYPCALLVEFANPILNTDESRKIISQMVSDKNVQVVYAESPLYTSLVHLSGNVILAFVSFFIMCSVMIFFISQIIRATYKESIRFWGLMKILGVTDKQIASVIKKDELNICLWPVLLSELSAYVIMFVSNRLAAHNHHAILFIFDGKSDALICGFVFFIVLLSVIFPISAARKKASSIPPLVSTSYYENTGKTGKPVKLLKVQSIKNIPLHLSRMFLSKGKKTFIFSVIFLFLGCETVLAAFSLAAGADYEKAFSSLPDFRVNVSKNACSNMKENLSEGKANQLFSAAMVNDLSEKLHDSIRNISCVKGYFPSLDTDQNSVFGTINLKNDTQIIIQPLDHSTLRKLCSYEKNAGRKINEKDLLEHHGAVIVSKNMLYSNSDPAVSSNMGRTFTVYDTLPYGAEPEEYQSAQLSVCGYAEAADKNFPEIPLAWDCENVVILAVSPDTYHWLGSFMQEQTISVSFNTVNHPEDKTKEILDKWLKDENYQYEIQKGLSNIDLLECIAKTDLIAENQNYIMVSRITMTGISVLFFLLGIIVFLNTLLTEYIRDRQEHILLRYLGVTHKEMIKAFVMEGLIYFAILASLLSTVGIYLIFFIGKLVKKEIPYFEFAFPAHIFLLLLAVFFAISVLLPAVISQISCKITRNYQPESHFFIDKTGRME
jgi:putative ABC transport system permease protein